MWKNLSESWKVVFQLAWESYCNGSFPIGAIVVDKDNNIISRGRNRVFEDGSDDVLSGSYVAHAEMDALMKLKNSKNFDIKSFTLYTSMEPCPMCFGAAMMIHIKNIQIAARDGFAGSICLHDKSAYLRGKQKNINFVLGDLEIFQIAIQTAFELRRNHPKKKQIIEKFVDDNRVAVVTAKILYEKDFFNDSIKNGISVSNVYDEVIEVARCVGESDV